MKSAAIGVIGGSGLYQMPELAGVREVEIKTPFGKTSDPLIRGRLGRGAGGGVTRVTRSACRGGDAGRGDQEDEAHAEEGASGVRGAGGRRLVGHGAPDDVPGRSVPGRSGDPFGGAVGQRPARPRTSRAHSRLGVA